MARRVFFSFHFERDIFRVNQVRMSNVVAGVEKAGFFDHSEYEEAKRKGDETIKRMIRDKLEGTTVTVVLIGTETAYRPYVEYEIEQSIARQNGIVGYYIHHLKDINGQVSTQGLIPPGVNSPIYTWDYDLAKFSARIEEAGKSADTARTLAALSQMSRFGR